MTNRIKFLITFGIPGTAGGAAEVDVEGGGGVAHVEGGGGGGGVAHALLMAEVKLTF
jgi:hypothetical protein